MMTIVIQNKVETHHVTEKMPGTSISYAPHVFNRPLLSPCFQKKMLVTSIFSFPHAGYQHFPPFPMFSTDLFLRVVKTEDKALTVF